MVKKSPCGAIFGQNWLKFSQILTNLVNLTNMALRGHFGQIIEIGSDFSSKSPKLAILSWRSQRLELNLGSFQNVEWDAISEKCKFYTSLKADPVAWSDLYGQVYSVFRHFRAFWQFGDFESHQIVRLNLRPIFRQKRKIGLLVTILAKITKFWRFCHLKAPD